MSKDIRIKIGSAKKNHSSRQSPKKHKDPHKKSFPKIAANAVLDFNKYKVSQYTNPVLWTGVTAGAGIKFIDWYMSKLPEMNEGVTHILNKGIDLLPYLGDKVELVAKPGGKAVLAILGTLATAEIAYNVFRGTKKSRIPLVKKIKYEGLPKISRKKNKELKIRDEAGAIGRARKAFSYVKDAGLVAILGGAILTGAIRNSYDNLTYNINSALHNPPKLSEKQRETLDTILNEHQKSTVRSEVYRLTDTRQDLEKAINKKQRVMQYESLVKKAVKKHKLHPDIDMATYLVLGQMARESSGDRYAVSKMGAEGLLQLLPGTQKDMGVKNPFDPEQNIMGGVKYLKKLADDKGNLLLALSYYNCRGSAIDWAREMSGSDDPFVYGAWLQKEPREYVPKVMAEMAFIVNGQKYAAKVSSSTEPLQFTYLGENAEGTYTFKHKVKKGENPSRIARDFNSWDKQNKKDEYKEVSHLNVTHPNGQQTNGQIKTGQTVHVRARGYR